MKGKVVQLLILLIVLLFQDYIFYLLKINVSKGLIVYCADYLFKTILIFLMIEGFIYKTFFTMNSGKIKILIFTVFPLVLSILICHRLISIDKFYFSSKTLLLKASDNLWRFDERLAHSAIPNSKGNYIYYIGDTIKGEVPVMFDAMGYRVVADSLKSDSAIKDLYLGDSFTFGDYVKAENTFPYLTSKQMGHGYVNAGASAYGIAQMYQRAQQLIPKNKFKYVFIQLSPWLVQRAIHLIGPTYYGYRPFPYFSNDGDSFKLNFPAFKSAMYQSYKTNWRETKASYFEKLAFSFTNGFKIEVQDYCNYAFATLKAKTGLIPKPTADTAGLETYFYEQLIELCNKNSAIPIILKLRYNLKECGQLIEHISKKAMVIDLDHDIDSITNKTGKSFENAFGIYHYGLKDSIFVDGHPGNAAHNIMAKEIVSTLSKLTN